MPDEAAAIAAANAWMSGLEPAGRPYEGGADSCGYALGGIFGQACPMTNALKPLMYFNEPLSLAQQRWTPYEQEFYGLLRLRRRSVEESGASRLC